jgi:CHAD domain-containing protein
MADAADEMPVIVYADELVNKLAELLPKAIREHDESAIHQSRVATRRLKAAAEVFERISSRSNLRDFLKVLRKLRRHLGPARDLDVMLDHLEEIKIDRLRPAVEWMRGQLVTRQRKLWECEAKKFNVTKSLARVGTWWGVRQDWTEAGEGLDCLIGESLHLQLDQFIEHADGISVKQTTQSPARVPAEMLDPHQLRIAGKALRYTLELAAEAGHKIPAAVGRAFKRMQDALGVWHDYVVLGDCALQLIVETELGLHDSKTAGAVLDLAKLAMARSSSQLAKFNQLWTAEGETLAVAIRAAFPLTQAAAEPDSASISELKAGRDPSGLDIHQDDLHLPEAPGEPSAA